MDNIESQAESQAEPQVSETRVDSTQKIEKIAFDTEIAQPAFDSDIAPQRTSKLARIVNLVMSNLVRVVILVVGDAIAFVLFAFIGMKSHGEPVTVSSLLIVTVPFALAWFVVSPFLGAYKRELDANLPVTVRRTAQAWLVSWPLALLIRGQIDNQWPPLIFALITLVTNMILLIGWRGAYAWLKHKRKHR